MKYTFKQFKADYPDDAACLDAVMRMRCGGTEIECPGCKRMSRFSRITKRRAYSCQWCGHHVYPCVGTPFEKSRRPLTDWFMAMYFLTSTRHGVAAKEIQRQIGMTYKCAWRMCHELRKLMAQSDNWGPMGSGGGHVEIDETMIGGRIKGQRDKLRNKTIVIGLVERDGIVRAGPIPDTKITTVEPIVHMNVAAGATISTDEHPSYADLHRSGYKHGVVTHSIKEYVRGIHHTNTIEGYWSRLKLSIKGTHVRVSRKHLWKYVSEFSYRFNYRHAPASMFYGLVSGLSRRRVGDW